jgi:hypothetical protein
VALLVLLTVGAAGCAYGLDPTSSPSTILDELPPAVAKKRDAIVAAARAFDYDGLENLLDRKTFSYSFGERRSRRLLAPARGEG